MNIHVFDRLEDLGLHVATQITNLVQRKPEAVVGLATGSSPIVVYDAWAALSKEKEIDNSRVLGFALDEYVGLADDHPESYHRVIERTVTIPVGLDPARVRVLDGNVECEPEAADFEQAIQRAGGVDLQLLGIGRNGHLGFNEPGSPFDSRTRRIRLSQETIRDNARFFDRVEDVPTEAITQGIGTILESKHLIMIATGEAKAEAVAASLEGPLSVSCPGSVLREHGSVVWYLDRPAASLLTHTEFTQPAPLVRE